MNWQYISGFFDADGYITMSKMSAKENETPVLGFTNTKLEILEAIRSYIEDEIQVKGRIATKRSTNINHNTSYDLKYVGFNKISSIQVHLNSIHIKKTNRLALLKEIRSVTPRNGKYTESILKRRAELVKKFIDIK